MGKPTICICENKGADQLRGNRIVHFLFFLNPKFQASSLPLCLYSSVCVGPVRKPHCWFSHETAQLLLSKVIRHGQRNHTIPEIVHLFCACTARFVSDLFGNHIVGFPTRRLNYYYQRSSGTVKEIILYLKLSIFFVIGIPHVCKNIIEFDDLVHLYLYLSIRKL